MYGKNHKDVIQYYDFLKSLSNIVDKEKYL
jgi:hypothetical protein